MNLIAPSVYNLTTEMEKYALNPDKKALICIDEQNVTEEITYKKLMDRANQIANSLEELGLTKGDRVLIIMPRLIETYAVYIACLKAGITVIPCSEMLRAKDLSYRVHHSEAKAIIADYRFTEQVKDIKDELPTLTYKISANGETENWLSLEAITENVSVSYKAPETFKDDMAFLSYTSGTTGQPKGVVHTHGWAYAHIRTAAKRWLNISEDDKVWATAGPGWQKWIWSPFLSTLGTGATGFVYQGKFDPVKYLTLLEDQKISVLCCTPTEYRLMAKVEHLDQYRLPHLRSAVSAGEPLNREVIDTFEKYFHIKVRDGYGQTENTLLVGTMEGMEIRPGSMGKPTPGNDVEVIDEHGNPVGPGEVGDIAVHKNCPALFKEYYKDQERTLMTFRGDYYVTGDRAKKDEDGYLWFEGRSDDIIISSGYTIGPFEVEDALVKHPAVKECAVVASPDEIRGHIVKAFVVLRDGTENNEALTKELQEHVKQLTAPYKYPRSIEYVSDLPKTTSGKIRRVELRQLEASKTR
ncbi:acyl-CoA synthetase MbcS [Fictibacillus barbaricus]|uniref:Acyl--CoA ligase n=1 Tax=Fictibacillus barbaricus TaxID=182136 RepID=A0ABS2ZIZ0_9BACL|nr:acyl--CoA ligase [Fictibacillus barbaricus]MBN3547329.1 acyl--CoA ligase [Fictibacillus barbaricus]GGB48196.1 acyl--CoA ligase [Fictibacillus barbaricus]